MHSCFRSISHAFVMLGSIVLTNPSLAQGTWNKVAPMQSSRHEFGTATGIDGRIYAIGGASNSAVLLTGEVYNPQTNTWRYLPNLPTYRDACAAACGLDGRIYVFGGSDHPGSGIPGPFLTRVDVYDPVSNDWIVGLAAPMPTARAYLTATRGKDGKIHVIGGTKENGDFTDVVEIYDPASNSWTTGPHMPEAKIEMAAVTGGDGRIYVIGGTNINGSSATVAVFNPTTNQWQSVANLLQTNSNTVAGVAADGRIRTVGDSSTVTEVYDPITDNWAFDTPCTFSRSRMGGATGLDGSFYVLGGFQNSTSIADVEVYRSTAPNPPSISNVYAIAFPSGATVHWKTTTVTNSVVEYGQTSAYGKTSGSTNRLLDHAISISTLSPKSLYHYRVKSIDAQGRSVTSGDYTFVTGPTNQAYLTTQLVAKRRFSSGEAAFDVLINNSGGSIAFDVILAGALLEDPATASSWFPSSPSIPTHYSVLGGGQSITVTITFPATAGAMGAGRKFSAGGSYVDLAFSPFPVGFGGAFRLTMP